MNVYVESNFVLELALLQERSVACEEILHFCEGGDTRLVVPAYCLMEPYETLVRRHSERRQYALQANRKSARFPPRTQQFLPPFSFIWSVQRSQAAL